MFALILLSGTLLSPCDPASSPTMRVVCPYLDALVRLDHDAMAALGAPDVVERAAGTRWGYSIDSVHSDSAFATLTESRRWLKAWRARAQAPSAVHDTLVDVGGYAMHLVVHRGSEPVTVVMESGGGDDVQGWAGVDSVLARRTRATVVAYDRAGFGRSGTGPAELTPREQIRQLHEALERLGTPPARIVVGTSYGGMMAVLHAHLYPANVRGLVLADPMNPRFVRATGDFVYSTVKRIEQPVTGRDTAFARVARTFPAFVEDPAAGDGDLRIPVVVITAGTPWWGKPVIERAWRASHEEMAVAGPDRRLVVAEGSRHLIAKERPETIVDGVVSLMAAGRATVPSRTDRRAADRSGSSSR